MQELKPSKTGIARIIDATGYSMIGFSQAWKHEAAFRQELTLAAVMIPLAFWLGQSITQIILMVGSCLLVLLAEILNSAIEAVVDRIGPEIHELSGQAKNMGSSAVFITLANVIFVWGMIIFENYF